MKAIFALKGMYQNLNQLKVTKTVSVDELHIDCGNALTILEENQQH